VSMGRASSGKLVFFLLFLHFAVAATVYGFVYDYNLNPAKGYVVSVNSTPTQTVILNDSGFYSFQLPNGFFILKVYPPTAPENATIQNLTIASNGSFEVDLLAFNFPLPNESSINDLNSINNMSVSLNNLSAQSFRNNLINNTFQRPFQPFFPFDIIMILVLVVFVVLVVVLFVLLKKWKRVEQFKGMVVLTGDEKIVFDKIKEFDGRVSQKELRKNLGLSEASVSIALTNLEEKGLIEKIKKGRGNIIKIK